MPKSFDFLSNKAINFKKIVLSRPPKSAEDVKMLFGCELNQVIKTILFCGDTDVLVCIPGDRKVNLEKLKSLINVSSLRMANKNEVLEKTGYPIGGVCPFLIENSDLIKTIDNSCFSNKIINIGSGKPEMGIEMRSDDLKVIWDGRIDDII